MSGARHQIEKVERRAATAPGPSHASHADGWTEARVEQLKQLWWQGGLSASQIANVMGGGLTRNGVIGKIHRLKLAGRSRPQPQKLLPGPAAVRTKKGGGVSKAVRDSTVGAKPMRFGAGHLSDGPMEADASLLSGPAWEALPHSSPVSVLERTKDQCAWPIGESMPYRFCGCPVVADGKPYCPTHARRASGGLPEKPLASSRPQLVREFA